MSATDSCKDGKQKFPGIVDGNGNLPVNYPCFKLTKPGFNEAGKHCSVDVFPLLIEEATFPEGENCTLSSSKGKGVCTISVLPDEGNTNSQSASRFTFLSFIKALLPRKNQMFLNAQLNCQKTQNCINVVLEGADPYGSCLVGINVEKGNTETVRSHDEVVGSMKTDSVHAQKVLQRQASLNTDKAVPFPDRSHDTQTNKWRKYKRAASFDSRKIVILFSILSSIGTLVLIYLTLRVKQTSDGFNHV